MEDERIIALFFDRDETAPERAQEKYGRYVHAVVRRIVPSEQDAEECANDTWRRAWETIPPERPSSLVGYLGMLARSIAIDRARHEKRRKRGGGQVLAALDELAECIPDPTAQHTADDVALRDALDRFLGTLPSRTRTVFVRRYWYLCPIADIAAAEGMSRGAVKALLFRTREQLKQHLAKEGIDL